MWERSPGAWIDPACPIEWRHPLNLGLVGCWMVPPNSGWRGGLTLRDLVRGGRNPHDGTLVNGPTWAGARGRLGGYGALSLDGTDDRVDVAPAITAQPFTLACWACTLTTAASDRTAVSLDRNATNSWTRLMFAGTSGGVWRLNVGDSAGTQTNVSGPAAVSGQWVHLCVTKASGGAWTFYINGQSKGTTADATQNAYTSLHLGVLGFSSLIQFWLGLLDDVRLYSRDLSSGEVFALYEQSRRGHPDTLRWVSTRAWFIPQTTTSITITAAQGTFSLSGQAAGVVTARRLTAAQGSFTLSGQTAGVYSGKAITAGQGSFALTGQSATLLTARRLTAAQGSFTLSGQTANLRTARVLTAGQGSFLLSGQTANVRTARVLTAAQGTFTLSGQNANVIPTLAFIAGQGSYTLSGQASTLIAQRRIGANQGSFILTGQTTGLLANRILTAARGVFSLSGQNVAIFKTTPFPAANGTFSLGGQSVGLRLARVLGAGFGQFTLSGQSATIRPSAVPTGPFYVVTYDFPLLIQHAYNFTKKITHTHDFPGE